MMSALQGHRRGSLTPLVALASLAGAFVVFRHWSQLQPAGLEHLAGNEEKDWIGSDRLVACTRYLEQVVIDEQKKKGPGSSSIDQKTSASEDAVDSQRSLRHAHSVLGAEKNKSPFDLVPPEVEEDVHIPVRLCPDCKCDVAGSYATSSSFSVPVPALESIRASINTSKSFHNRSLLRYLLHHIQLQSTLAGLFIADESISWLLTNHFTCPDNLIAFNFNRLTLDKPTSYIYTRTGPGGKLSQWTERGRYMQRHVDVIKEYQNLVLTEGFLDGLRGDERQLLWIVVEDDANLEPKMEQLLQDSGIPFLYFAHGPTRHFGKAQWNIVMRAIEVLRDGFFGDGPALNLDDDSRIVPELLRKIWKVSGSRNSSAKC